MFELLHYRINPCRNVIGAYALMLYHTCIIYSVHFVFLDVTDFIDLVIIEEAVLGFAATVVLIELVLVVGVLGFRGIARIAT